jgi:hypothetical protein
MSAVSELTVECILNSFASLKIASWDIRTFWLMYFQQVQHITTWCVHNARTRFDLGFIEDMENVEPINIFSVPA